MQQIGFSLYSELLAKAVNSIREGNEPNLDVTLNHGPEINFHLPALLPEDYMPDVHMRLVHYKRIASAATEAALRQLRVELIDRFGLLPESTQNLFRQTMLKLQATPLGIKKIDVYAGSAIIEFCSDTKVDPILLVTLISEEPKRYTLDKTQRLRLNWLDDSDEARFNAVESAISRLSDNVVGSGNP